MPPLRAAVRAYRRFWCAMSMDYYDHFGNEISQAEWGKLHSEENGIGKIVARYLFPEGILVSTVWLGINHNFMPDGPPLIFETLVFGGPCDQEMDRYTTQEEALEGHVRMVQHVRDCLEEEAT